MNQVYFILKINNLLYAIVNKIKKAFVIGDPSNQIISKEQKLTNEQNDNCITSTISKCMYKFF